jgi:hypothetical protein
LGSIADLAVVAHATRRLDAAEALRTVMAPYEGRLVIFGGANTVNGPVGRFLGLLEVCLGLTDLAVEHLEAALALEEQIGALPGFVATAGALAQALVARAAPGDDQRSVAVAGRAATIAARLGMPLPSDGDRVSSIDGRWSLTRDGPDWLLVAGDEQARLRDRRGLHFLVVLLGAPRQEIRALDLASGGGGLVISDVPVLDDQARTAYQRRLAGLTAEIEAADRAGDPARAERAATEHEALVDELKRAAGLGGRVRNVSAEDERARVNVTRALRSAIDAVSRAAPICGAHLEASIRTGRSCRYQPADDTPISWKVTP